MVGIVAVGMTFSVTLGVAFVWVGRVVGVGVCRVLESLRRNCVEVADRGDERVVAAVVVRVAALVTVRV